MATFDAFSGGCSSMVETEDTISLKKLAKRDSSTREKAIRELLERCTEDNVDTVVSTFSNFSVQFDKIIFDCSPTVRQLAMKLVSKQVHLLKKKAEKDLFNILPWILFASCDPYTPCSTEASNFLSGMFSKDKWECIMKKLSEKVLKTLEEILVSGESTLLIPSKLMKNDEEDSREERMHRLSEQSYGVLINFLKGESREEAEKILLHRLMNRKKIEMTRGLLNAVSHCTDPLSMMSSSSLFDRLLSVFSSPDLSPLLPLSTDLLLLRLSSTASQLNDNERRKTVNTLLLFIKKCSACVWDGLGVRLLPLFSSLCSLLDETSRATFISNWFNALECNGVPSKECILYIGDCIKYVLALLDSPSGDETAAALSMIFFLVSQSSSSDPSTLQSLIIWSIPRLNETKVRFFLEEVLRRCMEKLPSSRSLLDSLLSLHSDHLFFGWEYLHQNGLHSLPIHLLQDAPDGQLIALEESIGLVDRMEESGDASLAPLYLRLSTLLPSSSLQKEVHISYSPLISAVLTLMSDEGVERMLGRLKEEDRMKCVQEWATKEDTLSTIRLYRLLREEEKKEMEGKLLSMDHSLQFLVAVTTSCEFSPAVSRQVAERVIKDLVSQSLNETKAVYLSGCSQSVVFRSLDVPSTLHLITHQVMMSNTPLKVASFHSMATLFFDIIEHGMNLLEESVFFPHITSLLSSMNDELAHYSLLSHFWPLSSIDTLPYRPQRSSNLVKLVERLNKALALFLALYVHRSSDSPSGCLLLPIVLFSSAIRLARSSSLSYLPQSETETELLSYSQEMIESGVGVVEGREVVSLLSHSSPITRPLLIHSLRPLTQSLRSGSLPWEADTPFSALPTQGFNLHLEMARQLYYGRNVDTVLQTISSYSQSESSQELFTLQCDDAAFSLSMSALVGATELLKSDLPLSDSTLEFIHCGIAASLHSVEGDSKWEEGRRRLLAAAAIRLAILMNQRGTEEWIEFFLPTITPIVLNIYGEIDVVEGSALAKAMNTFVATHPALEWKKEWSGQWDKQSMRYDMEMDQAGIPSAIQTLVVRASSALEEGSEERGEAIVAASRIMGMAAVSAISFSAQDEDKGITVILPPFMKNLAAKDGWSRCGALVACLSLLSSDSKTDDGSTVERSVLCDAMAPLITKSLTTIVSKTEQQSEHIPSRYFIEKAVPSSDYFLHWLSHLLRETFSSFPSIVKMWYTGLPRSASSLVNRFISSDLSSILIDHEITQVMEGNLPEKYKNDQATLTIRRHANEILMDYILEDTRMRLWIKMPIGWPLLPPTVSVEGSIVGVEDGRKWMLQLNSQLHRNASVVAALSAWLVHAGKKVEGTESCTICMQLVAPQTKQLPKARCRTCHNKFHSSCLYKWFESSNQSSCPLCRTDFTAPP